jgi:hypothetical protein
MRLETKLIPGILETADELVCGSDVIKTLSRAIPTLNGTLNEQKGTEFEPRSDVP